MSSSQEKEYARSVISSPTDKLFSPCSQKILAHHKKGKNNMFKNTAAVKKLHFEKPSPVVAVVENDENTLNAPLVQ